MQKRIFATMMLLLAAMTLLAVPYSFAKSNETAVKLTLKSMELKLSLRDLWVGHIFG